MLATAPTCTADEHNPGWTSPIRRRHKERGVFRQCDETRPSHGGCRQQPGTAVTRRRPTSELHETHHRTAATCQQHDVNEWLATGPTTRYHLRAFFAWTKKSKINTTVRVDTRQAESVRLLTQDQRLAWIKELLCDDVDLLPYRVAGTLLLLYGQPMVKIVALQTTAIVLTPHETRISLGAEPAPVPEPFAGMVKKHLHNRSNLRTAGGMASTPWLFPGQNPGKHLDTQTMMHRLRNLGINLLGARNSALRNLVAEIPPPVVAHLLGYSNSCTQYHAQLAAQPWSRYVT